MPYQGPERRASDEVLIKVFEEVSATRAELRARIDGLDAHIKTVEAATKAVEEATRRNTRVIEAGKVFVWVMGGIGSVLLFLEAQWQAVTNMLRAILSRDPGDV